MSGWGSLWSEISRLAPGHFLPSFQWFSLSLKKWKPHSVLSAQFVKWIKFESPFPCRLSVPLPFPLFFFYIRLPRLIEWMFRWVRFWFNVPPAVWTVPTSSHFVSAREHAHAQLPGRKWSDYRRQHWRSGAKMADRLLRQGSSGGGTAGAQAARSNFARYCYRSMGPRSEIQKQQAWVPSLHLPPAGCFCSDSAARTWPGCISRGCAEGLAQHGLQGWVWVGIPTAPPPPPVQRTHCSSRFLPDCLALWYIII